jgi:hypothetical protein
MKKRKEEEKNQRWAEGEGDYIAWRGWSVRSGGE